MRFPGFIGPTYTLQSVNVDCQRCINLYPESDESGKAEENEPASLVATPGLSVFSTMVAGPFRASWTASNGRLFVVSGNTLYEISSLGAATSLGTLNTSSGMVGIADNGFHLMVVDGTYGYTFEFGTNTFANITDPNFQGGSQVAFIDGYFVLIKPNSQIFYISDLNAVTFTNGDAATAEGNPDLLVAILACREQLWLFNTNSTEVWFDSGDNLFPFQRISGAFIEYGCAAAFSVASMNNTVFWLGQDQTGAGIVYMAVGYQPRRISTHAVEQAIKGYASISDATAYTYQENGHSFYCLNFTSADSTWVFDTTTGMWHERAYLNQGVLDRHRAQVHSYAFGKNLVGDYQNGNLYQMTSSVFTDNGSPILRRRTAPHLTSGLKRLFYSSFQLDIESGTGIDGTGQGVDPQAMLQFSDDSGHTWSNEKWVSFGKIGQTKRRALWRRLGAARDRVFRVTITDPVKVTLLGAEFEIEKGSS